MGLLLHVFATSPFLWKRVADTPGRGEPPPLVPRARQSWLFCLSPSLCLRPSSSPAPPDLGEIPIHLHRLRLAARGKQGLVAVQIDIPSRQDRHDALARTGTPRAGEQRGHRGRARGFDDLLGVAREIAHPLPDSVIVDDDSGLDPRANDLERWASGDRRGETVRDRVDALEPLWRAVVERDPHRGRAARLDPDDAHTGPTFGQRDGEASDEAAATDGDDDQTDVRLVLEYFQTDRAVSGDHQWILVRMDQRRAARCALSLEPIAERDPIVVEDDLRPELLRRLDLRGGRALRHDDNRACMRGPCRGRPSARRGA